MDLKSNLSLAYTEQESKSSNLSSFQAENWKSFSGMGIPALKHEEWKYIPVKHLFKDGMNISTDSSGVDSHLIKKSILPGLENTNLVVFFNGRFQSSHTIIHEKDALVVKSLEVAAGDEDALFIENNLGHSHAYHPDGVNALNGEIGRAHV